MKKRYWIIPIAVAVMFLLAWLVWCKVKNSSKPEEKIITEEEFVLSLRPENVMVSVGKEQGSGVIIDITDEKVTIVTAGHLMLGYEQGIITFPTGNAGFANVEYVSENPDLCVMSFLTEYIDSSLLKELRAAKNDISHYEGLEEEQTLFLLGSAMAVGSNAVKGKVAAKDFYVDDFDARMIYIYADVMAGMSGCGIYDEEGYLVGILAGGSESGEAVAVPLSQIYEIIGGKQNDKD